MRTGLQEIDGNTYYFALDGMLLESKLTGWQEIDGNTYYVDENGAMARGSWIIDGEKYMFGESGILWTKKQQ